MLNIKKICVQCDFFFPTNNTQYVRHWYVSFALRISFCICAFHSSLNSRCVPSFVVVPVSTHWWLVFAGLVVALYSTADSVCCWCLFFNTSKSFRAPVLQSNAERDTAYVYTPKYIPNARSNVKRFSQYTSLVCARTSNTAVALSFVTLDFH